MKTILNIDANLKCRPLVKVARCPRWSRLPRLRMHDNQGVARFPLVIDDTASKIQLSEARRDKLDGWPSTIIPAEAAADDREDR